MILIKWKENFDQKVNWKKKIFFVWKRWWWICELKEEEKKSYSYKEKEVIEEQKYNSYICVQMNKEKYKNNWNFKEFVKNMNIENILQ